MDDQLNGRVIWAVTVYHGGHEDHYYFWDEDDLLQSIRTTWSKSPHKVKVIRKGNSIEVRSTDLLEQLFIIANRQTLGFVIQDRPTHF